MDITKYELLPPSEDEIAQRKIVADRVITVARTVLANPVAVRLLQEAVHLGMMMPEKLQEFIAIGHLNEAADALLADLGADKWSITGKNFSLTVMFLTRRIVSGKISSIESEEAWNFVFDFMQIVDRMRFVIFCLELCAAPIHGRFLRAIYVLLDR